MTGLATSTVKMFRVISRIRSWLRAQWSASSRSAARGRAAPTTRPARSSTPANLPAPGHRVQRRLFLVRVGRRAEQVVELVHQAAQVRALGHDLAALTGNRLRRDQRRELAVPARGRRGELHLGMLALELVEAGHRVTAPGGGPPPAPHAPPPPGRPPPPPLPPRPWLPA